MSKDWKDCPFGTVYTYTGSADSFVIKLSGQGGITVLARDHREVKELYMRRVMGCGPESLQWMIPKEYLT